MSDNKSQSFIQTKNREEELIIDSKHNEHTNIQYYAVLLKSKTFVNHMFLLNSVMLFVNYSISTIWILYAQKTQSNPSHKLISLIINIGTVWKGISTLINISLSNRFGYDKGVILLFILNSATVLVQSLTDNFIVLSIGFILFNSQIYPVVFASIAWILPHKNALEYTSLLNVTSTISFIIAPGFAGIISHYLSYRWMFYINFILGCVISIYALIFIRFNRQKQLETEQINIKYKMKTNDEIKYPIYIKKKQDRKFKQKGKKTKISCFECIMLFLSIFVFGMVLSCDTVIDLWYTVYIHKYINSRKSVILYATMQLLLFNLGQMIGIIFVKYMTRKLFLKYIILLISTIGYVLIIYFIFCQSNENWNQNKNIFYLYMFSIGILLGCMMMSAQRITLEFQPPSKAGYIQGFAGFWNAGCVVLSIAIVGYYWDDYKHIMFFVQIYSMMLAFIASFLMGSVHICCNRCFKSNKYRNGLRGNESTTLQTRLTKSVSAIHSINS